MTIKVQKTEREFRDALDQELPELPGEYTRFQVGNALIRALDLEFQEPEGRGEVPEELGLAPGERPGVLHLVDGDGNFIGNIGLNGSTKDRVVPALEKALGAYNDFPDLLGLAWELRVSLEGEHGGQDPTECCPVCDLLTQARDLLDRPEGGRP